MTISKLEVGVVPLGVGGDSLRSAAAKINENFSNTTHAASRLVGTAAGQVSLNENLFKVMQGGSIPVPTASPTTDVNTLEAGDRVYFTSTGANLPTSSVIIETFARYKSNRKYQIGYKGAGTSTSDFYYRFGGEDGTWSEWATIYSTGNTTKDVGTGFLKVSSPVLHVYNDKIDKIHEAEQLDITVDKKGVGHYEIYGTTGLRQNDGWNMSPPRDIHGNVRCMIEVTEKDEVITVKTYKRKFDLELAAIVHDYDNPLDIPDGACVELRFNDLPQEQLDDIQTEV